MSTVLSGTTRLACVLGSPVRHSLSPAIHNAAFLARGVDAVYLAFEIDSDDMAPTVRALRNIGFLGASITMPHKEVAHTLCDEVGPVALRLGSLNTLVARDDGSLFGESTDGDGCVGALQAAGARLPGSNVVVVGAGATARACILALAESGVSRVVVVNRTRARSESAALLAPSVCSVVDAADTTAAMSAVGAADIVVHATPAGMGSDSSSAFDLRALRSGQFVLDAVYQPLETPVLAAARASGAVVVDGLSMLIHQAARQQELWTRQSPDIAVMRAAAEHELERRRG
jgi:shikimate dehydrogenase